MRSPRLVHLANSWRAFRRAKNGNVTVTFAVALVPLLGLTGMAIDYSLASSLRAAMQSAADATALAVAKEAPNETATVLQTTANTNYRAVFTRTDAQNLTITATYTATPNLQVLVSASASIKPRFMSMLPFFGLGSLPINVSSTTTWGMTRLRVALALDNTGSMADSGKIGALQTATKNLLTQLKAAATKDGDVYVSIIPFSRDVNVGSSNYTASWIDWTDWEADSANQTCTSWDRRGNCTASSVNNHNTWNGCITDRGNSSGPYPSTVGAGYDQLVTAPGSSSQSKFPADQYGYCPLAMMGLSFNWTAMTSLVNSMYPNGATDQPIGLVWAWQSLVGGGPLTAPALNPAYTYQQVIILLSDGLNTQDRWYGNGSSTSTQVDARMYDQNNNGAGTCKNIKTAGITIYTIQVNTGGDPTSTLLRNCASNTAGTTDHFYLLTSANQIITTFQAIGTKLSQLRIAK